MTSVHHTLLDYAETARPHELRWAFEAYDRLELLDMRKLDDVIGELERCVMQIVVAPLAFARPSASVTSRLAPVCEMPSATSPGPNSAEDIAIRSPSESATARIPSLRNLW